MCKHRTWPIILLCILNGSRLGGAHVELAFWKDGVFCYFTGLTLVEGSDVDLVQKSCMLKEFFIFLIPVWKHSLCVL